MGAWGTGSFENDDALDWVGELEGADGLEVCYPADFEEEGQLVELLNRHQLGVSAVNFRSRRTGKWWRGSFLSESPAERTEVVDDLRRAMDHAAQLGCHRVTTCPLNEGTDVPFEADFPRLYDYAAETFAAALRCVQRGDWEGWASLYAPDAVLHAPQQPALVGAEAILAWGQSLEVKAIDYRDVQVFGVAGSDVAYGTSAYELELEDAPTDIGKQLVVFRRDPAGWRAVAVEADGDRVGERS